MSLSNGNWTTFQIDAEFDVFGTMRIVNEHNRVLEELRESNRQRDAAVKHLAEWCVAIDEKGGGWDEWDEYYKEAMYSDRKALPEIRDLLVTAIEEARKQRANW